MVGFLSFKRTQACWNTIQCVVILWDYDSTVKCDHLYFRFQYNSLWKLPNSKSFETETEIKNIFSHSALSAPLFNSSVD